MDVAHRRGDRRVTEERLDLRHRHAALCQTAVQPRRVRALRLGRVQVENAGRLPDHRVISVGKRLTDAARTAAGLLAFGLIDYVLIRASSIFGGLPCLTDDLYGASSSACREALQEGRRDPWAPFVVGAILLYAVGALRFLLFSSAKDRDWKGVATFSLIGLGWLAIAPLSHH